MNAYNNYVMFPPKCCLIHYSGTPPKRYDKDFVGGCPLMDG